MNNPLRWGTDTGAQVKPPPSKRNVGHEPGRPEAAQYENWWKDLAARSMERVAMAFMAVENEPPDMSVRVLAGAVFDGTALTEVVEQFTPPFTAPASNARIDRIVIDLQTGATTVVTGTEAPSPTAPPIPPGKAPVCRIMLSGGQAAIVAGDIVDERTILTASPEAFNAGNSGSDKVIDWDNGQTQHFKLTDHARLTLTNGVAGRHYRILVKQDALVPYYFNIDEAIRWARGFPPKIVPPGHVREVELTYVPSLVAQAGVGAKLANPATLPGNPGQGCAISQDGRFLAVAISLFPYIVIYERSGTTFTKLSDPATLPTGIGRRCAFSQDGRFLAVAHSTTPFITIYERSGTTFTKVSNPATLPAGTGFDCAFSQDGRFLAVAHPTNPFITIYERSGTTFTKVSNPATLPTGDGWSCAFSQDGRFLAVGHEISPRVTIYERSGTTFTKVSDPATVPPGFGLGCAFSPCGRFLAVACDNTSPYIVIYERSGTTFTKLSDPATLPTGTGRHPAFSQDGRFLAVAHSASPNITIYERSGTTFTKLSDPATLPASAGLGCAFSQDGRFLAVAHSISPSITIYDAPLAQMDWYGEYTSDLDFDLRY